MMWSGFSCRIAELAESKNLEIGISNAIYDEFCRVLDYPRITKRICAMNLTAPNIKTRVCDFVTIVERVSPVPSILEDATDAEILACAVDFKADTIISGDKKILTLAAFENIPIMRPSEFVQKYFPDRLTTK